MPKLITTDCKDPWRNLAVEEYLLETADDTILFLWQNENTVVIGRNQNAWKECNISAMEQDGVKLARRITGGGAVFHDLGNLNFSFIASQQVYSLERQFGMIISALDSLGIGACLSGRNDILAEGFKISGNAFAHYRANSLHHGTLLVSADMSKLANYLTVSKDKLAAKGIASVRSRVANLCDFKPELTIPLLSMALARAFENDYGKANILQSESIDAQKIDELEKRNSTWEWRMGKSPAFNVTVNNRFTWGRSGNRI